MSSCSYIHVFRAELLRLGNLSEEKLMSLSQQPLITHSTSSWGGTLWNFLIRISINVVIMLVLLMQSECCNIMDVSFLSQLGNTLLLMMGVKDAINYTNYLFRIRTTFFARIRLSTCPLSKFCMCRIQNYTLT